jgi:hypothetical protein
MYDIEQLWLGKIGDLYFGSATENDICDYKPILDVLKSLPVHKIVQTVRTRGFMVSRNDKNGRLR